MSNDPLKILAIIGARSGSKGLPDKNIKLLVGKPLMAWIIAAAQGSQYVNRVILSTDSAKYADIARGLGAEVPFLRPAKLASDTSSDFDYIYHAVEWLKTHEQYVPDIVVRLFPPVPLQTSDDIDRCLEALMNDPQADSAVVIAEARQHPAKALKLIDDGKGGQKLVGYWHESGREVTPTARQNYPTAYFRANVIASRLNTIYTTSSLTGDLVRYHIIPQERSLDIDTQADFDLVEKIIYSM